MSYKCSTFYLFCFYVLVDYLPFLFRFFWFIIFYASSHWFNWHSNFLQAFIQSRNISQRILSCISIKFDRFIVIYRKIELDLLILLISIAQQYITRKKNSSIEIFFWIFKCCAIHPWHLANKITSKRSYRFVWIPHCFFTL